MRLTGRQINDIQACLLEAYPNHDELRMMVRIGLNENLGVIAGGDNQRILIFNLLTWAERSGRISELVESAHAQHPSYPAVQRLMEIWQTVTPLAVGKVAPESRASRPTGPATVDVFLSASRKDSEAMRTVQESLRKAGLAVWTDENLVPGTSDWKDAIQAALSQAQALVVLLSPSAMKSEWVNKEIGFALARRICVFPVLVEGDAQTSVPIDIINTQWVDGRNELSRALTKYLLPELQRHLHPLPVIVNSVGSPPPDPSQAEQTPKRKQSVGYLRALSFLMLLLFVAVVAWYVRGYTLDDYWSPIGNVTLGVLPTEANTMAPTSTDTPLPPTASHAVVTVGSTTPAPTDTPLPPTVSPTTTAADTEMPAPTATPQPPTASPTATATDVKTPISTQLRTPTATAVLATATSLAVRTSTLTATPTRVAPVAPSDSQCLPWSDDLVPIRPEYTAVILEQPAADAAFTGPNAQILLTWQGSPLAPGKQHFVVLRYPHEDGIYYYDFQATSATSLIVPRYIYANMLSSSRDVTWFVVILEGEVCKAGYWGLSGSVVSAKSDTRNFLWKLPVTGTTTPVETQPKATPPSDTPVATPPSS